MSSSHATAALPQSEGNIYGANWQKLMMWAFVVTDGLLFAGLLTGYGFVRVMSDTWPASADVFHLSLIGVMTFVLITSSTTMASAVAASREGDMEKVRRNVLLTLVGGLIFLGMQAFEWADLIGQGAGLSENPWGVPLFGASFFLITGFHGTHVLTGLIVLATVWVRSGKGLSTPDGVECAGLYWHFVDLAWVFIFTLFYLI